MDRSNAEILDRLPPQDLQAEKAVLGSVLNHPEAIWDLDLKPVEFYADANQRLWRTLQAMSNCGKPIDPLTVFQQLVSDGYNAAVGGAAYLLEVRDAAPVWQHAQHYAGVVRTKAKARAIIHAATEAMRAAWDPMTPIDETLTALEASLSDLQTGTFRHKLTTAADAVAEAIARIEQVIAGNREPALMTGLLEFDQKIGGLPSPGLTILAARSGVGKTSLATQIIKHVAERRKLTYFASLEMDAAEIVTRMLCGEAEVNSRKIQAATVTKDDLARIVRAGMDLGEQSLIFDDRPELTVQDIRRTARQHAAKGLRFVVVDYLQIITPGGSDESRERQVASVAMGLKALSRELKVPVLALCQTNRDGEKDQRASLRHLRESDAIGQCADMVLILECGQTGTEKEREAWLNIVKHRNGPKGKLQLDWIPERTLFKCHEKPITEYQNYEPSFEGSF